MNSRADAIGAALIVILIAFLVALAGVVVYSIATIPRPAGPNCGNCNITLNGTIIVGQNQTFWVTDAEGSDEVSAWPTGVTIHIEWEYEPGISFGHGTTPANSQDVGCGKGCTAQQWGGWTPWIVVHTWTPKVWIHVYCAGGLSTDEYFSVVNATTG